MTGVGAPGAITITQTGTHRLFNISGAARIDFRQIRFTNGDAPGLFGEGGAIRIVDTGAYLGIYDSEFEGNSAGLDGGAISISSGAHLTVERPTFFNNSAALGGAIEFYGGGGEVHIRNSTFNQNSATDHGGAISEDLNSTSSILELDSVTIYGNSAPNGSGISKGSSTGVFSLVNSIVSGNTGGANINGTPTVNSFNIIGAPPVGTTLSLGPLAYNGGPTRTMALLPGSDAAIDKGNTSLTTDQRSRLRPAGAADDKGAFETLAPTAASVAVAGRVTNDYGRGVARAWVFLTHSNGTVERTTTNPFGYFRFAEVEAGTNAILTVESKQYVFEAKMIGVMDEITDVTLVGLPRQ